MKTKLFFLLFVIFSFALNAQDYMKNIETIINSEKKIAEKIINGTRNMNTENYDLKYHRFEFNVDPNVAFIEGNVTSYFEALEDLNEITFELSDNMTVDGVLQRGNPLIFTHNSNNELVIELPTTQNIGVLDSLTIKYSGNPVSSGFGSFIQTTHNGDPIIWTLSEPYGALDWWPCKQDLNDKIDAIDVFITTPQYNPTNEEYFVASNGLEQSQIVNGDYKTTHFKHQYPIPAYLIAFAVTNYEIYTHVVDNKGNPFDVVNYVYPEDLSTAQAQTPITVDYINFFADLLEEYPFSDEKYGHAQFGSSGFIGMEHTTVSFMGNFDKGLITHELAHSWFGNKITCGSWQDIWINEGFATYLEFLRIQYFEGEAAFQAARGYCVSHTTWETDGSVYVPAQDITDVNRVFNARLSYYKPAMVLHMLSNKLGEATFRQGLRAYLADPNFAFGYAKTPDFQSKMEEISGVDLTDFFNDWIYGEGYPSYHLEWERINANQIGIVMNQTQSHPSVDYFELKVPMRVFGILGETMDFELDNTTNGQQFIVDVPFDIINIIVDPDRHIISKGNTILDIEENTIANSIVVYPNPSKEIVHIKTPATVEIESVEIYSVLGQKVKEQLFSETIDISELTSGIYYIHFDTNYGRINKSLIKQ